MNMDEILNYAIPVFIFLALTFINKKSKNLKHTEEPEHHDDEVTHHQLRQPVPPSAPKQIVKQKIKQHIQKHAKPLEDVYLGLKKVDPSKKAYQLHKEVQITRGESILNRLRSNKDMIVLHEIIGPPKGLRPPYQ
jgi:hypothetical protein